MRLEYLYASGPSKDGIVVEIEGVRSKGTKISKRGRFRFLHMQ